jgi:K+-transporting ATPase KdpF subunit
VTVALAAGCDNWEASHEHVLCDRRDCAAGLLVYLVVALLKAEDL